MSLLSDQQIGELCTQPSFVVTSVQQSPDSFIGISTDAQGCYVPKMMPVTEEIETLSHMSEQELEAARSKRSMLSTTLAEAYGIRSWRPVTTEDLIERAWKPMIEPFVPGQVRTRRKIISRQEYDMAMSDDEILAGNLNLGLSGNHAYREEKVISYGTSSYGYDIRCSNEFKIFTNVNSTVLDPKSFGDNCFVDFTGDVCIIPPNSFVLTRSLEYFRMPRDVTGLVLGKSTYARTGISCLATPLEAGWEGHITLEFANTTPLPARLYANEGVSQVLFFRGEGPCITSYADRGGKYMFQQGVVLPRV